MPQYKNFKKCKCSQINFPKNSKWKQDKGLYMKDKKINVLVKISEAVNRWRFPLIKKSYNLTNNCLWLPMSDLSFQRSMSNMAFFTVNSTVADSQAKYLLWSVWDVQTFSCVVMIRAKTATIQILTELTVFRIQVNPNLCPGSCSYTNKP